MSEVYHAQQLPLFPVRTCKICHMESPLDILHFVSTAKKGSFGQICRPCLSLRKKHTPETIAKINAAHARMTPEARSARSVKGGKAPKPSRRGMEFSDEWKKNLSDSHMGHACYLSDEQKQKNGERFAAMNRTRTVHAARLPYRRAMSGENMRRAWQEKPDQMFASHRRKRGAMTSIEKKVWCIVEPLGFTYESIRVRSHQRWYFPDFSCGNLLIEVLGSYWHNEEETAQRVAVFESQGFRVLTIWDDEIGYTKQVPLELKNKIEAWYKEVQS